MRLSMMTAIALSLLTINSYAEPNNSLTEAAQMQKAAINQSKGKEFLSANQHKPGVVTLPSGLQYKIIKMGQGETPTKQDTVTVNYSGSLINGKEFDSSYKRGQPATFPVNGVISGWTEALQLMKVGSVWELYIPAKLAYGEQGAGSDIGPNETLIFKVELLKIEK